VIIGAARNARNRCAAAVSRNPGINEGLTGISTKSLDQVCWLSADAYAIVRRHGIAWQYGQRSCAGPSQLWPSFNP
jgi:hypothetical protein